MTKVSPSLRLEPASGSTQAPSPPTSNELAISFGLAGDSPREEAVPCGTTKSVGHGGAMVEVLRTYCTFAHLRDRLAKVLAMPRIELPKTERSIPTVTRRLSEMDQSPSSPRTKPKTRSMGLRESVLDRQAMLIGGPKRQGVKFRYGVMGPEQPADARLSRWMVAGRAHLSVIAGLADPGQGRLRGKLAALTRATHCRSQPY